MLHCFAQAEKELKHQENQEPCVMRGVYFKNMKWQAAIKVEKKQVHLGTVNSQEEAARLYDRFVINSPFLIETKLDHFTSLCRTRDWCWKKDLEAASKSGMFVRSLQSCLLVWQGAQLRTDRS
jgi:hypothetical protein